ncbi:MAG: hypothetical protein DWQ46_07755 [Planctomycetota bacterium]|nr:MAG: hypothetical protein DWQ46_07755 [Planctomycetota bacterium]
MKSCYGLPQCVIAVVLIGLASCKEEPMAPDLHWDLSRSRSIDQIGWPANMTEDRLAQLSGGRRRVTVQLPSDQVFDAIVQGVYAQKLGNEIDYLTFEYEKSSLHDSTRWAADLIAQFGYEDTTLGEWKQEQLSRPNSLHSYQRSFSGNDNTIDIEIRNSFNDSRPWKLWFDLHF